MAYHGGDGRDGLMFYAQRGDWFTRARILTTHVPRIDTEFICSVACERIHWFARQPTWRINTIVIAFGIPQRTVCKTSVVQTSCIILCWDDWGILKVFLYSQFQISSAHFITRKLFLRTAHGAGESMLQALLSSLLRKMSIWRIDIPETRNYTRDSLKGFVTFRRGFVENTHQKFPSESSFFKLLDLFWN